jgi:hypothetical protein
MTPYCLIFTCHGKDVLFTHFLTGCTQFQSQLKADYIAIAIMLAEHNKFTVLCKQVAIARVNALQ